MVWAKEAPRRLSTLNHYHCQTNSAVRTSIPNVAGLAPDSIESVHGTRCDACGDVRLYQVSKDGTTDADASKSVLRFSSQSDRGAV